MMTENELKKRIEHQTLAISMLSDEYQWRMRDLLGCQVELNKLDRLVYFCNTGKFIDNR